MSPFPALPPELEEIKDLLISLGQSHLFDKWPPGEEDTSRKRGFFEQVKRVHDEYPGGLRAYVENAKRLLKESSEGVNPFAGYVPHVPEGQLLNYASDEFVRLEEIGLAEMRHAAFVLVAGGLGERLGYNGIKLSLPVNITTNTSYLEWYLLHLKAFQVEAGGTSPIPLAIMTSDDTHDATVELLKQNDNFGMPKEQVTLMKQEKVPSIQNNDGAFVLGGDYTLETKPHGHGDVHQLLHSTGLAAKWLKEGRRWVIFIQDTNAMVFNVICAAVGLSKEKEFEVNSLCIPRKAGEAIGGIARLVHQDGREMTVCVEYNQLDPLLRDYSKQKGGPEEGDVADPKTGLSPYPGNTNSLVFALAPYTANIERTKGLMPEFVNPKYADKAKTQFKKPTRLECMMQDYPKILSPDAKVGFVSFDRLMSFSPVKNNTQDAILKVQAGLDANSPSSGECEFYAAQAARLEACGVKIEEGVPSEYDGITVRWGPRVVLYPSFAPTHGVLSRKIHKTAPIELSANSTFVVKGREVYLGGLHLDGHLQITAVDGAKVTVDGAKMVNRGYQFRPLDGHEDAPEYLRIRGYALSKEESEMVDALEAGDFLWSGGELVPRS